jgi:hypothetical protein
MSLMDLYNSDPVWGPSGLSGYWPLERERSILYNAVIGFTNVFQLSKLFLLFLFYLLLTHLELLLLHSIVAHPELDAEP